MRKLLIILSLIYTALLSFGFILGMKQTPPGYQYMGVVHHPNDYFYYLSQFAGGKTSWFASTDMYTTEAIAPSLVGMTNVFAGRIFSLAGVSPIIAYQVTLALYTFLFFLLVIFFLERVYPRSKEAQLIAFILLAVSNTFPWAGSFFANVNEPLTRFPRVPHQMLALICIILPMVIITKWQDKKLLLRTKIILGLLSAFSGIILANINPVQWALIVGILFIACRFKKQSIIPIVFFLAGLPMVYYLWNLFKTLPFTQIAIWESWQQIPVTPVQFIESFGPVFLLSLIGLPLFFKRLTLPRLLIIQYSLFSILIFLSPLPRFFHITNVRFLSAVTILGECIIAAFLLVNFPLRNTLVRKVFVWGIVSFLVCFLTPFSVEQFKHTANLDVTNSYIYLSPDAVKAYEAVGKLTGPSDIILVTWPYDASLPALTGRRGFIGHPLLTVNSQMKNDFAYKFFDGQISDEAIQKQLAQYRISYVLEFTGVTKMHKPFLSPVFRNPLLTLYKVVN